MRAEYIDNMGTDLTVVNAARVSFDKKSYNITEQDKKLIKFLAVHNHFTPFTHPQVTLRETVPIFTARQRFKHTVGFSYNEVSRRYVDDDPQFYIPDVWRGKAENKKQGSSDQIIDSQATRDIKFYFQSCELFYKQLLFDGVAPEQARMVLPQAMYTSYYVTGSLAAWARAYNLRIKDNAQKEIQLLAKQWYIIIESLFPISWKELTNV